MADDLFDVDSTQDEPAVVLRVRVQPSAGRSAVTGRYGDALGLRVAAPPVGGRANAECLELVADLFGVRKSQVELVAGEKNRQKRFRVSGLSPEKAAARPIARELRSAMGKPGPHERADRATRSKP